MSLLFAQISAVYAIDTSSCPMMESMSHSMAGENGESKDMREAQNSMSCCNDVVMQDNIECCDTSCQCSIGVVSFISITKVTIYSLQAASLRLVRPAIDRPGDIYLKQVQRPPIHFIF